MEELRGQSNLWAIILDKIKTAHDKETDPFSWALNISSYLTNLGVSLPSHELAKILVSHICWDKNVPFYWKLLEKSLDVKIVSPLIVLPLLSIQIIPNRRSRPAAYRLYMELVKGYALTLKFNYDGPNFKKIIKLTDNLFHLSDIFGIQTHERGIFLVEFIFSIVWQLLDASLDDEGLIEHTPDRNSKWSIKPRDMEIDNGDSYDEKRFTNQERLQKLNTVMAIELIVRFLQNNGTSGILHLARQNMPAFWRDFSQRMQLLVMHSSSLKNSKLISSEVLLQLITDNPKVNKLREIMKRRYLFTYTGIGHGISCSSIWLPLDLMLEDAMDDSRVIATSLIEIISGLLKALQAINCTPWHVCFLGLWMAALRLVQRERDPIEGPVPGLDTRLSMLLTITTLVIADLIEEEESDDTQCSEKRVCGKLRMDLVTSLQSLGDYKDLLNPPKTAVSAANQAITKAMMFISGLSVGSISMKEMPMNCSGNLHHLIVEACIARNLLDTSAYFWPGYVKERLNQIPPTFHSQVPGWSSFMEGTPLSPLMIKALVSTPASSLAELEKVLDIAVKGSDDERIAAATILCGASLVRGWNVQEHAVHFIIRLLSSPVAADCSESSSFIRGYGPIVYVLLVGIAPVDCIHIFSQHGLVPQLAGSLMPLCEVFGSCIPNLSWTLPSGEEISSHSVFSNAFALLLKLWKFNHPPLEDVAGGISPVGSQLTPEKLLQIRNSQLFSSKRRRHSSIPSSDPPKPVFLDSFPKLKSWYRQHQACIAATLSGLVHGTPIQRNVDQLINMVFQKSLISVQSATVSSSSSGSGIEDISQRPKLPAWDILEAVPFVVDAALTACAHGGLSTRELCTGLKHLADFLPAALLTIVSYFSAEVTRGIWKPAFMNGTDWPSPAPNLANVKEQITKLIAATGVDIPSLVTGGSSAATLPLPLAAFVSLTITYKLDNASQRFLSLAGPALESLAAGCPWPCMPIVASLWTLKVKRWTDFLIFSASKTVFLHNNKAIFQLIKSCFTATLSGGVGTLLGHGFGSHINGGNSPVAPAILYLRVYRSIRDIIFLREEILSLLMQSVKDIAPNGFLNKTFQDRKRTKNGIRYGRVSFATAMTKVKTAASLGASLVCLSGGFTLVHSMIKETLPSWFISAQKTDDESGIVAILKGHALSYFVVLCGAFAWGVESATSPSKRRLKTLGSHMEFLASAFDGGVAIGCDWATWHAYVCGFLSLVVVCTPSWVLEIDVEVLKRLSKGLMQWNEEELALALLGAGGVATMGAAAEFIINSEK